LRIGYCSKVCNSPYSGEKYCPLQANIKHLRIRVTFPQAVLVCARVLKRRRVNAVGPCSLGADASHH